ncbi:MAG: trigger factor, partial [Deltaproteobacteria bacterium]|nr:trigger factor [Deltaproteobacteria bacterium]
QVEVLPEIVNLAREKAIQEVQKKAQMRGFRAGKVPRKIIEEKFLHELQKITIEHVVDETLLQTLQEQNIRPISRPEIEPGMWQPSGGFSYKAVFEVMPEIPTTEQDYLGLKLEKEEVKVIPEEINQELERLQQAMTQLEPLSKETPLAKGLVAILDYTGQADGKAFKDNAARDLTVELGAGGLLKEFEEGLAGARAGDAREITFNYPKDYFNKELAGKKGEFKVKIKSVRKKNVPKLDDEFAKDLGQFKTLAELRQNCEQRIAQSKEFQQRDHLFDQIIKQLVEKKKFEIPTALVMSELNHLINELARDLEAQGQDIRKLDAKEVVGRLQPNAEFRVRSFLVLNKVSELLKVEVTEAELEKKLEAVAKQAGRPVAEMKGYYEKHRLMGALKARMLHEKALENVLKTAKIKVIGFKTKEKGAKSKEKS